MKNKIKKSINNFFFFYNKKVYSNHKVSFSQEGEDRILEHIFKGKKEGFYIDIGANNPTKFNNTYLFYLKGWRGINIEPNPDFIPFFKQLRPGDTNLNVGISDKEEIIDYYVFDESCVNTFSKERKQYLTKETNFKLINTIKIKCYPLCEILNDNLSVNQDIDFMSIDTEGFDFKILKSNNWSKFLPKYILVEDHHKPIKDIISSEISKYLEANGYSFYYRTYNTSFFKLLK
jgi:FkbM family methyltransferase